MSDDTKQDAPLGIDGNLWAEAFCKLHPTVEISDALGWFCNAIMAGYDEGFNAGQENMKDLVARIVKTKEELSDE